MDQPTAEDREREVRERLAEDLERAASSLRRGLSVKILVGSIANSLRWHWCDACTEYTHEITHHDGADDRDLCEKCAIELQVKVTSP